MASNILEAWEANLTWTIVKFAVLTIILIVALVLLFTLGNLQEIAKNFPRYRCYPILMPFAGNFGYDARDNFNYCLNNIFLTKATEIFQPIYKLLGGFVNIISTLMNAVLGIRKMFSNMFDGVVKFARLVRDKIQSVLFTLRATFMKMINLMNRVYGTMMAVLFMGLSAQTAALNVGDNDLVKFLFEFCFDPNTLIARADGSFVPIKDLKLGDTLRPIENVTPVVTSLFVFDGSKTPMVKIGDVTVSSAHYVNYLGKWITAAEHPESVATKSVPSLICLNVNNHEFYIGKCGLHAADYDEHSTVTVNRITQHLATKTLNCGKHLSASDSYDLGIDGRFLVKMKSGKFKELQEVVIGDVLGNGDNVVGTVVEMVSDCAFLEEIYALAPAQLVYEPTTNLWKRAFELGYSASTEFIPLYNIITDKCTAIEIKTHTGATYFIRDYREVPLPEMEDAYSDEFSAKVTQPVEV